MKKILFIGMNFYNYEEKIITELSKKNFFVIHYCDAPYFFMQHFKKISMKSKIKLLRYYHYNIVRNVENVYLDYIFVIVGRYIHSYFLEKLKTTHPESKFILYLWDDVKRVDNISEVMKFYDEIYTFDPKDAEMYNFKFLPLFYKKANEIPEIPEPVCDVYSIMSFHSDREDICLNIIRKNDSLNIQIFLRVGILKYIKPHRNGKIIYVHKNVREEKMAERISRSRSVLDIQFPSQIGLTIRTFDVIGLKTKLITTNDSIKYYDFYNENNILIIDRKNPIISKDFLSKEYIPIDESIMDKYTIDNWINCIFFGKKEKYLIEGNPFGL